MSGWISLRDQRGTRPILLNASLASIGAGQYIRGSSTYYPSYAVSHASINLYARGRLEPRNPTLGQSTSAHYPILHLSNPTQQATPSLVRTPAHFARPQERLAEGLSISRTTVGRSQGTNGRCWGPGQYGDVQTFRQENRLVSSGDTTLP